MASPSQPERLLFAEPFLAWRAWTLIQVDGEPRLESCIYPHVWEPRTHLVAECKKMPPIGGKNHDAPNDKCACGIYGSNKTDHLRDYVQEIQRGHPYALPAILPSEKKLFGLVALWGIVVECTNGYRAQKAYPRHLYLPRRMHDHADGLHKAYGVPVTCITEEHGFAALRELMRTVRDQEEPGDERRGSE